MNSNEQPETPSIFCNDEGEMCLLLKRTPIYKNKKKQKQGDTIMVIPGKICGLQYIASTRTTKLEYQIQSVNQGYLTTPRSITIKHMALTDHNNLCKELHDYLYRQTFVNKL